jgi:AAA15 family ATPase/GTPase
MKLSQVRLQNFRRFKDFTISITHSPQFVLVSGANGAGKSSLFDAFNFAQKGHDEKELSLHQSSYYKYQNQDFRIYIKFEGDPKFRIIDSHGEKIDFLCFDKDDASLFSTRTSIHHPPRLIDSEERGEKSLLSSEEENKTFQNDITAIVNMLSQRALEAISNIEELTTVNEFISKINNAFRHIFNAREETALELISIRAATLSEPAVITLKKGSHSIEHTLLSDGEKDILCLLLNLSIQTSKNDNTIFFLEGIDLHLEPSLHYNLVKELVENWIPEHSQLWIASHSQGFLQYANESSIAQIVDLDGSNFDFPVEIASSKEKNSFELIVPEHSLKKLLKENVLIYCEAKDTLLYDLLTVDKCIFAGEKYNRSDVVAWCKKKKAFMSAGIIDRGYLSESEVKKFIQEHQNIFVLKYFCLENYLFHPDNIHEMYPDFDNEQYALKIAEEKNTLFEHIQKSIVSTRKLYIRFTDQKEGGDEIANALKSDNFETFYPYFSMKDRGHLSNIVNIGQHSMKEKLITTQWFEMNFTNVFREFLSALLDRAL